MVQYVHLGPFCLGQPSWATGRSDYKGNLFGVNRYSVKFIQSQRDLLKEGELLGKWICSENLCYSPPLRTKEYNEGKSLVHSYRIGAGWGAAGKAGTWCQCPTYNLHLSVQKCVALPCLHLCQTHPGGSTVHLPGRSYQVTLLILFCISVLIRRQLPCPEKAFII